MTEKIIIEVDAVDNASGVMKGIGSNTENAVKKASMSWTDFYSAYMLAMQAVRVGQQVWEQTAKVFIDYADQVRDVSRSIGSSAEEASRLIQVADDVFISYDKLTVAMKMAAKQGIDPSIEGLAKLSDEYLKLKPGVERTQFLLKTFGKSGADMGKLMEKGGDGVRKMSSGIQSNLILTKEATDAALRYKQAQDNLNDTLNGMKVALGSEMIGLATNAMNNLAAAIKNVDDAAKKSNISLGSFGDMVMTAIAPGYAAITKDYGLGLNDISSAATDASAGVAEFGDSVSKSNPALDAATKALDDYKKKLDEVSQANQDAESFMQSYADFSKGYAEDHTKALEDITEAETKLKDAIYDNGKGSKEALAAMGDVTEAKEGLKDLEASWFETTNKMIYDMALAKVSLNGYTDAEYAAMQKIAVEKGIRTQAEADIAMQAMEQANAIADGVAMQEDVMKEKQLTDAKQLELENAKAAAADTTTQTVVNGAATEVDAMGQVAGSVDSATQSLIAMGEAAAQTAAAVGSIRMNSNGLTYTNANNETLSTRSRSAGRRDSGGEGMAGVPYMIGTGAQPEVFIPKTAGTFIPNADKLGGSTYNIVINNPKKEETENSIRKSMKTLSALGVAA